jgi:serine/threonine-protein kinase HipA
VPEAEFAALELARAAGVSVPRTRLVDVDAIRGLPEWATRGGGKAFLIQRFDRGPRGRVHVEVLAQILNLRPARKYERANFETVARTTAILAGPERVGDVIDRIVVNVLVGNGDAHVKNWAYRYGDGRSPDLAPAYDVVPTVLFIPEDDLGLKLNGSRAFDAVDLAAFERLADKAGWDGALGRQRAADAVDRVLGAWQVLTDHLRADRATQLTKRRDRLPLLRTRTASVRRPRHSAARAKRFG